MQPKAQDRQYHDLGRAPSAIIVGRLLLGGAFAALIIVLMVASAPRVPQGAQRLTPVEEAGGSVTLPISTPRGGKEYAVYAAAVGGRARLEHDGDEIINRGSGAPGGLGFNSRIVFAPIGLSAMSGEARIRLSTQDDHGRMGVGSVFEVPSTVAEAAFAAQTQWAQRNQWLSIAVGVAASFLFMMRLGRQPPDEIAWPAIALSNIVVAQALAKHPDVGAAFGPYIDGAEYMLAIWAVFAVASFAARWRGQPRRKVGSFGAALLCASTLLVFIPQQGIAAWLPAAFAVPALALALAGATTGLSVRDASWRSVVKFSAVTVAACSAGAALVRAADPHHCAHSFEAATVQSLGALPLLLTALGAYAANTIADRRESLARLKTDFAAQSAALAETKAALEEEARRRVLLEERSRITRDMHDGIGGRLLSLLVRVRTGKLDIADVEHEVQGSLNDLRLIVDSLDTAGETLGEALAEFRARATHQLKGADITLRWTEENGVLDDVAFEPDATLNLFRILQEAIANVVRHSGANSVEIAIVRDAAAHDLRITVRDNGRGLAQGAITANGGKGLKYMEARARQLDGRLEVDAPPGAGCRVALVVPLAGAQVQDVSGSSRSPS